jgi:hypothetical protein
VAADAARCQPDREVEMDTIQLTLSDREAALVIAALTTVANGTKDDRYVALTEKVVVSVISQMAN